MKKKTSQLDRTELKKILQKHSIHPSHHRLQVLKYLIEHKTHPTVDMIYRYLSKKIPTLSKTTVYNTLKVFLANGIVIELTIDENELRYDANVQPHAHFKCTTCGQVFDIFSESMLFNIDSIDGHKITEYQVYLKGTCKNCLKSHGG